MRAADSLGKERRLPDHSKERLVAGERAVEHLPQERIALDRLAPELEISGILRAETSPIRTQIADLAVRQRLVDDFGRAATRIERVADPLSGERADQPGGVTDEQEPRRSAA